MSYIGKKNGNPNTDFLEAGGELENHDLVSVDSSGNLLVGKTSSTTATAGFEARNNGQTVATLDGTCLIGNRLSTDGDIFKLMKDGTTVGSISVYGGSIIFGRGDTGLAVNDGLDAIYPIESTGSPRNNAIDIGRSSYTFKDLYLGGGVYVGGTGSANYLDDYEEGTWTPDLQFGTANSGITYHRRSAYYTKVGNTVTVTMSFYLSSKGSASGHARISGFPFNFYVPTGGCFYSINARGQLNATSSGDMIYLYGTTGISAPQMYCNQFDGGGNLTVSNGQFLNTTEIDLHFTYLTS